MDECSSALKCHTQHHRLCTNVRIRTLQSAIHRSLGYAFLFFSFHIHANATVKIKKRNSFSATKIMRKMQKRRAKNCAF